MSMRKVAAFVAALAFLATQTHAQTVGNLNLFGPGTIPKSPQITPQALNQAVNNALGLKLDAANGTGNYTHLNTPTVNAGTFNTPALTTPTITTPAITGGGTWAGAPQISGGLTVTGGTSTDTLAASGNSTVGGTLAVTGATTLHGLTSGAITATGGVAAGGPLTATNGTFSGTLGVTGTSTLGTVNAGPVTSTGAVSGTTLGASGNATVGGTLAVTGASTFTGAVTVPTAVAANQPATLAQVQIAGAAPGRNLLVNPYYNINHATVNVYPFNCYSATTSINGVCGTGGGQPNPGYEPTDHWREQYSGDSASFQSVAAPSGDQAVFGLGGLANEVKTTFTGVADVGSTASFTQLYTSIEYPLQFSGMTVTYSFYARAATAGTKVSLVPQTYYGSGGSPTATVNGTPTVYTLTTTLQRYTATFTLPNTVGTTRGTNSDDATYFIFYFSSGALRAATAGLGVQSGTIYITGNQLEYGTVATPLEPISYQDQRNKTFRYIQYGSIQDYGLNSTATIGRTLPFYVPMLKTPTMAFPAISGATNVQAVGVQANDPNSWGYQFAGNSSAGPTGYGFNAVWYAYAENL
jgi:hypothetical protein